jgi:glutaredoxin
MREYFKFKYLFSLAVVVALLCWLGVWGIQEGRTSGLSELSISQTYTAEQFINRNSPNIHVYVLYKPKCPVCKEFGNPISDVLRGRDSSTYSVVNVENGVPSYLVDYFSSETFEGIHVPYIIIAQGNSILYEQRIESYEILEEFKTTLENINIKNR